MEMWEECRSSLSCSATEIVNPANAISPHLLCEIVLFNPLLVGHLNL